MDENENSSNDNINDVEEIYKTFVKDDNYFIIKQFYKDHRLEKEHIIQKDHSKFTIKKREKYKNNIDARQPGIGKTQEIVDIINNREGKNLIIGDHDFLKDVQPRITKEVLILKGFEKCCSKLGTDTEEGKQIKFMIDHEVPKNVICHCMNCSGRCYYREQWKRLSDDEVQVICIPVNFLMLFELDEFENVFVEERIERDLKAVYDIKKIKVELAKLLKDTDLVKPEELQHYIEIYKTKNLKQIERYTDSLKEIISDSNHRKIERLQKSGMPINEKFIKSLCLLKVYDLLLYLKFEEHRQFDEEDTKIFLEIEGIKEITVQRIPFQQILFLKQIKSKKEIRYNCATFAKIFFLYHVREFEKMFPEFIADINIQYSNFTNPNFKIIKHGNKGFYRSTIDKNLKEFKKEIKNIIDYNKKQKNKICILTFMDHIKNGKFMGCDAFYFGGKHGTNTYRNYNCLIVVGTLLPNHKSYLEYMRKHHPDLDCEVMYHGKKGIWEPTDENLKAFYEEIFLGDVYDSVHRIRPLWNDKKSIVHWFGNNVPEKLKEEGYFEECE